MWTANAFVHFGDIYTSYGTESTRLPRGDGIVLIKDSNRGWLINESILEAHLTRSLDCDTCSNSGNTYTQSETSGVSCRSVTLWHRPQSLVGSSVKADPVYPEPNTTTRRRSASNNNRDGLPCTLDKNTESCQRSQMDHTGNGVSLGKDESIGQWLHTVDEDYSTRLLTMEYQASEAMPVPASGSRQAHFQCSTSILGCYCSCAKF